MSLPTENPHCERFVKFVESLQTQVMDEINEIDGTISNEHLWELGYTGEEPNLHSQNIEWLKQYESKLCVIHAILDAIK